MACVAGVKCNGFSVSGAKSCIMAAFAAGLPLCAGPASAGFLDPVGRSQVITTLGYSSFSRQFDAQGRLKRSSSFTKSTSETRVSYGYSEHLTLIAELAGDRVMPQFANDPGAESSWSAIAGARVLLWRGTEWVFSGQVLAGGGAGAGRAGLVADARLALGRGFKIGEMAAFADVQGGYRHASPGNSLSSGLMPALGSARMRNGCCLRRSLPLMGLRTAACPTVSASRHKLAWCGMSGPAGPCRSVASPRFMA